MKNEMKNEMKLEELEMVNGGSFLDDIVDGVNKIKDKIEEQIKNLPRLAIGKIS